MGPTMGVLGGAWVRATDGSRARPTSPTHARLLASLVLNRSEPMTFDVLASAIWPDRPYTDVAHTMRVHVSNLRKWLRAVSGPDLGSRADQSDDVDAERTDEGEGHRTDDVDSAARPSIETIGTAYRIVIEPQALDTVAFESSIMSAQRRLACGDARSAVLDYRAALSTWGVPFPELVDFIPAEAERIRLTRLSELAEDELVNAELELGEGASLVAALEARLVEHPYRESTYRQLMLALYVAGRQADALGVFARARRVLRDELGVEPGPGLQATQLAILNQTVDLGASGPLAAGRAQAGAASPIRHSEIDRLDAAIDSGAVVVLSGEAGSGKTHLLDVVRKRCSLHWMQGAASDDDIEPPLWPVLAALDASDPAAGDVGAGEWGRNAELIRAVSDHGPAVLVIDDFHWADGATIRFLRQLTAMQHDGLAVVLARRNSPADLDTAAGRAATELARQPTARHIELAPLDREGVAAFVATFASDPDSDPDELVARTGGNTLFLSELVRSGRLGADAVLPGVAALVHDRLAATDDVSRLVLHTAAVLGSDVDIDVLLRVAATPTDNVVTALDIGRRLGLLIDRHGLPSFVHGVVRDALNQATDDLTRHRIHDHAAAVLVGRQPHTPEVTARLAFHSMESLPVGDAARAVTATAEAGAQAQRRFAFVDARRHYERSIRAADLLTDEQRRGLLPPVLCELGYTTIRAGNAEAGTAMLLDAGQQARDADDAELLLRVARCVTEGRSPPLLTDPDVVRLLDDAYAMSAGIENEDRVQLLADRAGVRYYSADLDERRALVTEAVRLADALDDDRCSAIARTGFWAGTLAPSTAHERVEVAHRAIAAARRSGSLDFSVVATTQAICSHLELGAHDRARRLLAGVVDDVHSMQVPRLAWFVSGWGVLFDIMAGRLDDAERSAGAALGAWEDGTHPDAISAYGAQLLTVRLLQGRHAEVVELADAGLVGEPDNTAYLAVRAFGCVDSDPSDARRRLDELRVAVGNGLRDDVLLVPTLAFVAETAHRLSGAGNRDAEHDDAEHDDVELGRHLIAAIEPFRDLHVVVNVFGSGGFYWGSLRHALGLAHDLAGDAENAARCLTTAAEIHRRVGADAFTARSLTALRAIENRRSSARSMG